MLSRKYRFHSRGGVKHTYQKGKTLRRPYISLVYTKNERGFLRFGVVVSKKVLKSAVGRNTIRRRVYEAIRLNLPKNAQADYIFIVYSKEVKDMPFNELQNTIKSLLDESMI